MRTGNRTNLLGTIGVFCCVAAAQAAATSDSGFIGEYMLARDPYHLPVCTALTRNLNQFRKLDFDTCHPRLSKNYPEFSRPEWQEIPFDMAIAEDVIKDGVTYSMRSHRSSPGEIEALGESHWGVWKRLAAPYLESGKARMWRLEADITGDGHKETLIRLMPGDIALYVSAFRMHPETKGTPRPTDWPCDNNQGDMYVLESKNPKAKGTFNFYPTRGTDLIHLAGNDRYYLLQYRRDYGGEGFDLPPSDAPRSIGVQDVYVGPSNSTDVAGPVNKCVIQWYPKGTTPPEIPSRSFRSTSKR